MECLGGSKLTRSSVVRLFDLLNILPVFLCAGIGDVLNVRVLLIDDDISLAVSVVSAGSFDVANISDDTYCLEGVGVVGLDGPSESVK